MVRQIVASGRVTVRLPRFLRRFDQRVFWAVFLGASVYFIAARADFFFGPAILEAGDDAANALQIAHAKHGAELLGNYSRWGFHHPGPAFFYVYAAGELLLRDLLRIVAAPGIAHVFTGVLLQSFLFAAAFAVVAYYNRRASLILLLVAAAFLHFRLADRAFVSTWPPHQLLMPFLCLLIAGASVATGRLLHLPLLTLVSGFLIHGHVNQPLFVGCTWLLVAVLFWKHGGNTFAVQARRQIWLSVTIAAVFALPLLIDATRGRESNLAAILTHLREHTGEWKSLGASLFYLAQFPTYWTPQETPSGSWRTLVAQHRAIAAFWCIALVAFVAFAAGLRMNRSIVPRRTREFWSALTAITLVAAAASLFWGMKMDGPMFAFNSFFNYAILFCLAMPLIVALERLVPLPRAAFTVIAVLALAVTAVAGRHVPIPMQQLSASSALDPAVIAKLTSGDAAGKRPLLWHSPTVWVQTASLGLAMERAGVDFAVRENFTLLMGRRHLGWPNDSLRHPQRQSTWLMANKSELAVYVDEMIDLGKNCYAQQWQKLRRMAPGSQLLFNDRIAFIDGFSEPEDRFRWTNAKRASVFLPLAATGRDAQLRLLLHGLVDGRTNLKQNVSVRVGARVVGAWQVSDEAAFTLVIPSELVAQQVDELGGVILDFDLPNANSPKALGINQDTRLLGLAVHSITCVD